MTDELVRLIGSFNIWFIGDPNPIHVNVAQIVTSTRAHILWLEDESGHVYNWSTITRMEERR